MRTAVGGTAQPLLRDERSRAFALARWFVAAAAATGIALALGQQGAAADETSPAPDPLSGLLSGLVGQIAPPLGAVVDTVTPVISPVVQPLNEVLTPVVQPVVDVTGQLTAPLAPVLDQLLDPLNPVIEPLAPIVETLDPLLESAAPFDEIAAPILPGGSAPSSPPAGGPSGVPSYVAEPQVLPEAAAPVAESPVTPDLTAAGVSESVLVEPTSPVLPAAPQPSLTVASAPSSVGSPAAALSEAVGIVTNAVDSTDATSVASAASPQISQPVREFPTSPAAPADRTPLGYVASAPSSIARVVDGAFGSSAAVLSSSSLLALAFAGWVLLAGHRPRELARGAPLVPPA